MRTAIALFALVQLCGFVIDALWHGVLNTDFEATSAREMATHLATVHLPLYVGVVGFFATIARTLFHEIARGTAGTTLWIAMGGATAQLVGEAWHAWTHLRLSPEAVVPGMLSFIGFVVALVALGIDWRRRRGTSGAVDGGRRRAA
jgi:hypothetical protein